MCSAATGSNNDVERLCEVDVSELVALVTAISFDDWPQQARLADGKIRPAMASGALLPTEREPVVSQVMKLFPGCQDYNHLLSVVMPGASIEPHCDPQGPQWLTRIHVPLTSNDQSRFIVGGVAHRLEPGTAYKVNIKAEHAVDNDGTTPRIHFMWDVMR